PRPRNERPATLELVAEEAGRPLEEVKGWADEGLLGTPRPDGRWHADAVDRAALIAFAVEQGASFEEVRDAVAEERLPLLSLERVVAGSGRLTGNDVARRAGVAPEFAGAVWRALGFPSDDLDAPVFGRHDVEAMRVLGALRGVFGDEDLIEMASVLGRAMAEIAAAAV